MSEILASWRGGIVCFNVLRNKNLTRPVAALKDSLSIQTVVGRNFASENSGNRLCIQRALKKAFAVGGDVPLPPLAMLSSWAQCPLAKFIPVKRPSQMLARRLRDMSTLQGGRGETPKEKDVLVFLLAKILPTTIPV